MMNLKSAPQTEYDNGTGQMSRCQFSQTDSMAVLYNLAKYPKTIEKMH